MTISDREPSGHYTIAVVLQQRNLAMTKKLILVALALLLGGIAQAQTTFKIATLAPATSEWFKAMQATAIEVRDRTDGRVEIKLFGGGVMGSDEQVMRKIRIGQLHGAATVTSAFAPSYKDIILYGLPMVFKDEAEARYVRARLDAPLMQGLEEAGFVGFGFATTGFSIILSNDPIHSVEDMRGLKIWAPPGDPSSLAALRSLDLVPVLKPMGDIYTSLQTGNINVVPFSAIGALVLQLHTEVDYLTDLPLVYTAGIMAIQKKAFAKLPADDQQIVREVIGDLYRRYDEKNLVDDADAKEALINSGVQKIVPSAEDLAEISRIVLRSNLVLAEQGEYSLDLYTQMLDYVAEYRGGRTDESAAMATDAGAEDRDDRSGVSSTKVAVGQD
jgi:TRAP-type C4-dicarboxylate transport system substrate-binding protein